MDKRLIRLKKRLNSTLPLFGAAIRRSACKELAAIASAVAVPYLVETLNAADPQLVLTADAGLRSLKNPDAIDALCMLWVKTRNERIGKIIEECQYRGQKIETDAWVLSTLKSGPVVVAEDTSHRISALVKALDDKDTIVSKRADQSIRSLHTPPAVDALCGIWSSHRDTRLKKVIGDCGYVASGPTEVRVLTALIANKLGDLDLVGQEMEALVHAAVDKDSEIAARADRALRTLGNVLSRNALCAMAIQDPKGKPARICIEQGWRPSDPNDACLFLCVTEQIEEYFREDFEFQNLRLAYDRADEHVRARVLAIVRSGDRRWQGFFGVKKPASQCTAAEIELAIESGLRHADWPQLWSLFQQVAFKYTWRILGPLLDSGWKPTNDEDRKTFDAVLEAATGGGTRYEPQEDKDPFSFADLLAQGRNGELARKSEAELLSALAAASPPDAIPIVGAISTTCGATSGAARAVMTSPHWMVRLAGSVAGLGQFDTNLLLDADGIMLTKDKLESFWPLRATPEDLENLRTWPLACVAEDAVQMYCVLEQVLFARLTTGTFTEVIIEAAEDAGEFEEVQ